MRWGSAWTRIRSESSAIDQELVRAVIELVSKDAIFGMLAVLDNVANIEKGYPSGEFDLAFVRPGKRLRLNTTPR